MLVQVKRAYEAAIEQIYERRAALRRHAPADALQRWVDCAEELAAVAYDVFRFEAQVQGCTDANHLVGLTAKSVSLKKRHADLTALLAVREKELRDLCPEAASLPFPTEG